MAVSCLRFYATSATFLVIIDVTRYTIHLPEPAGVWRR